MATKPEELWAGLEANFVTSLHEKKVEPVPDAIVKLAQLSLDGQPHPQDESLVLHAMQLEFDSAEKANAFAEHMRNAGMHTTPLSSVTVVVDPERGKVEQIGADGQPVRNAKGKIVMVPGPAVNPNKVAWRSGARRGRTAGS